jgi:hypothetical protein
MFMCGVSCSKRVTGTNLMKTGLITFFAFEGIVLFEFIPQGQTVNQAYFVEVSKRLHEAVHREGPELCPKHWILQLTRRSLSKQFVAQKSISEMEHPLSFPDLAPNDFCFKKKKKKSALKGRRFQYIEDIKEKSEDTETYSTKGI